MTADARILVATTNPGKIREIEGVLGGTTRPGGERVTLVSLRDFPAVAEPEETGETFAENSRLKALYYAAATGLTSVADDSGLEIDALDGAPGVHSARWHGTDYPVKFRKIYELLGERRQPDSPARFVCHVTLASPAGRHLRNRRHHRRPDCAGAARDERIRLRPDLLLPAVRLHAGRARSRPQGDGQPPRLGLQPPPAVPGNHANRLIPTLRRPRPSNALEERFMTFLVLTLTLISAVIPSGFPSPPQTAATQAGTPAAYDRGTWRAHIRDTWTQKDGEIWTSIRLYVDTDREMSLSVPLRSLEGLDATFTVRRDAGQFAFKGSFTEGLGTGTWQFTPNAEFVTAMRQNYPAMTPEQLLKLAALDVSRSFVAEIRGEGYTAASLDEIAKMRIHRVDAQYIREMRAAGYDKLSVADLVKTRIHGATPAFAQEMKAAGLAPLPVDDLVKMRIHGVSPELVREMKALGYGSLDAASLVKMRIHGVSPELVREMKDLGYGTIDAPALVRLRIHGVTPAYVRELRALGYTNVSPDQLVKLRIHGVTTEYVTELQGLGYRNVPVEDLVRMRIHGVTPAFVKDVQAAGFKDMSPSDLVDFSIHGKRWLRKRG